jgi:hypothetical protein
MLGQNFTVEEHYPSWREMLVVGPGVSAEEVVGGGGSRLDGFLPWQIPQYSPP